jgi:hypothetical protein|tara:strand:- start:544 stop:1683 length:1140 start_codon:yes stop_codon:yes gene_type:complete
MIIVLDMRVQSSDYKSCNGVKPPTFNSQINIKIIKAIILFICQMNILKNTALVLSFIGLSFSGFPQTDSTKIKGISLVAPSHESAYQEMDTLVNIGTNWVCLMPYGFINETDATITFDIDNMWWGEQSDGLIKGIVKAKALGLKVMVKPMLWMRNGSYTGELQLLTFAKWTVFEEEYNNFATHFAEIADSLNVEIFCIGTELKSFCQFKPNYFNGLVDTLNKNTALKLTYAANWDNYQNIPFWNKLDFIGVDAYFPLLPNAILEKEAVKRSWVKTKFELKDFAEKNKKQILFTEYGYTSTMQCVKQPWNDKLSKTVNDSNQEIAIGALIETFYPQPWFVGGFLWKWYDGKTNLPKGIATDYTPQGKSAKKAIKNYFYSY